MKYILISLLAICLTGCATPAWKQINSIQSSGTVVSGAELDKILFQAVTEQDFDSIDKLIAMGADPRRVQKEIANIRPDNAEMIKFQSRWCKQPIAGHRKALISAIEKRDLIMIKALFAAGCSPNQAGRGHSVLWRAIMQTNIFDTTNVDVEIIKACLIAGANPNIEIFFDYKHQTPLGYVEGLAIKAGNRAEETRGNPAFYKRYTRSRIALESIAGHIKKFGGRPGR